MGHKTLKQLREELLANRGGRAAFERQAPEFAILRAIIAARTGAGLSQAELAARTETATLRRPPQRQPHAAEHAHTTEGRRSGAKRS